MRADFKTILLTILALVIVFFYGVIIHTISFRNPLLGQIIFWVANAILVIGIVFAFFIATKKFTKPVNYSNKVSLFYDALRYVFHYVVILIFVALLFVFLITSMRNTLIRVMLAGVFVFFYGLLFYTIFKLSAGKEKKTNKR